MKCKIVNGEVTEKYRLHEFTISDVDDIDIESEDLNADDWVYFKRCIEGYYEKLYEFMSHYGDYYEDGYIKWLDDMPDDLQKRIKRHIKLKSILRKK
jgi:hypothetical protein